MPCVRACVRCARCGLQPVVVDSFTCTYAWLLLLCLLPFVVPVDGTVEGPVAVRATTGDGSLRVCVCACAACAFTFGFFFPLPPLLLVVRMYGASWSGFVAAELSAGLTNGCPVKSVEMAGEVNGPDGAQPSDVDCGPGGCPGAA